MQPSITGIYNWHQYIHLGERISATTVCVSYFDSRYKLQVWETVLVTKASANYLLTSIFCHQLANLTGHQLFPATVTS